MTATTDTSPRPGTGPGSIVSGAAGPKLVHFDRVEFTVMPDQGTAAAALGNGEVDWWENPSNDILPVLERNKDITTRLATPLGNTGTGIFNHLYPPFDKAAVRRVVLEAMSQKDFMEAVAGTDPAMSRSGIGIFTPGTPMANDADLGAITRPRDMPALRQALKDAGYKGETVLLMSASENPVLSALGEGLQRPAQAARHEGRLRRQRLGAPWSPAGPTRSRRTRAAGTCSTPAGPGSTRWTPSSNRSSAPMARRASSAGPTSRASPSSAPPGSTRPDLAAQQKIARDLQTVAFQEVPFLPTGQYFYKTANRRTLLDPVDGMFVFWNAKRA